MGNVVFLPIITKEDLNPEAVLAAAQGNLEAVVIVGVDHEGQEYFASSIASGAEIVWMFERAKHSLMKIVDDNE